MSNKTFFRYFFLALFAVILYQLLRILAVFLTPLALAAVLVVVFYPLHRRILRIVSSNLVASFVSTASVIFVIVFPLAGLSLVVVRQSVELYPSARQAAQQTVSGEQSLVSFLPESLRERGRALYQKAFPEEFSFKDYLLEKLRESTQKMTEVGTATVKNVAFFLLDILILIFTLFFLFKDGEGMLDWIIDLIPMEEEHKRHIVETVSNTFNAIIRGLFLTATAQGILAGIGFVLAGVGFPVVLGFLTSFLSLIPFGGAVFVWAPAAAYLFLAGKTGSALFLAVWGFFVVSLADNFLKPILIGGRTKLPLLFLFFGIIGGIRLYGFLGALLGPILIACALAFVRIYREEFLSARSQG